MWVASLWLALESKLQQSLVPLPPIQVRDMDPQKQRQGAQQVHDRDLALPALKLRRFSVFPGAPLVTRWGLDRDPPEQKWGGPQVHGRSLGLPVSMK
mmetsp:Transcript_11077/g.24661  ORF Transcript_11077/g.24661 Transcript_11077/m.24661 type:complete len:97 (-) Transcript_11077:1136-1426(-)